VQALNLSKARARNQALVMAHEACIAELQTDNARLRMELEEARQALAEANAAQSSLPMSQEELEQECVGLRATVDTLK
jgi:regulator of replication initiation timing